MLDNLKKIFEKKHEQSTKVTDIRDLMTEAQYQRGQYYRDKYVQRSAEMSELRTEFDRLLKLYECERSKHPTDPTYPNNFLALLTPIVEGQTASMMEGGIEYQYLSNNPSHKIYLPKLESASAYCRRINSAENHYKDFTRFYEILGNAVMTPMWEKSYSNAKNRPDGYPRIMIPAIYDVLFDGRIKDYKDIQHCEYIIHKIGYQDIAWARKEYGDEKADGISLSLESPVGENGQFSIDDMATFVLLNVWTRDNEQGNLQLIEMDTSGFILRESDPSEPYYTTVDNEYPFYLARMMPKMGNLYGFGDGKILEYLQTYTNNLADELELAVRFNGQPKTYVDPRSEMDMDQYDSDPSHVIICNNPRENVYTIPAAGINPIVLDTIQMNMNQAQRATRFSDIMNGTQQGVSATATQINGQLSQGSIGIKDKASDIQRAMAWCDRYCVRLCLQYWTTPFWIGKFRSSSDEDGSEFIDMQSMTKIPAVIPASGQAMLDRMKLKEENPNMKIVNYESVYEKKINKETGKMEEVPVYTDLDYNVEVKLSSGFPRGKNDLFNQIISLLQIVPINADGFPDPLMDVEVARAKLEEVFGFKLKSKTMASKPQPIVPTAGQVNPLSTSGEVAQPQGSQVRTQPSNLMGTVPMAPDNRGLTL
jgi:hypothetical protein